MPSNNSSSSISPFITPLWTFFWMKVAAYLHFTTAAYFRKTISSSLVKPIGWDPFRPKFNTICHVSTIPSFLFYETEAPQSIEVAPPDWHFAPCALWDI